MARKAKLLIGLTAFAACQSAAANPIYYDCDTPGAKYSEIKFNQSQPDHRVRGTITPMELRPHDWRPAATVYLESQDKRHTAAVQLVNSEGTILDVAVSVGWNGQITKTVIGQMRNTHSIAFDLYMPSSGQGFAEVGGKRVPLKFSIGPNAKVSVTCSSGHFRFDPLDWDWEQLPGTSPGANNSIPSAPR